MSPKRINIVVEVSPDTKELLRNGLEWAARGGAADNAYRPARETIERLCGDGTYPPRGFSSMDIAKKNLIFILGTLANGLRGISDERGIFYDRKYPRGNSSLRNGLEGYGATTETRLAAIKDIEAQCAKVGVTFGGVSGHSF